MSETVITRIDTAVEIDSKVETTPEGYLKISAPIARTGIYTYHMADGSIQRELVTEDTLFDSESISTLKLKPVTNRHPTELLLDTKTVKRRNVGSVGETIKKSGDKLVASFIVTDQDAINAVNNGRKQLSPGYQTVHDRTPGTWNGQPYDVVQTKRIYNHLALVDKARGGEELKINIDSEDEIALSDNNSNHKPISNGDGMSDTKTIKIDGASVEVPKDVAQHVATIEAKLDTANDELAEVKKDNGELQKKVDSFDAELKTKVDAAVNERVDLVTAAKDIFKTDSDDDKNVIAKLDGMSNDEIKRAIIVKVQPSAKAKLDSDDLPEGYVDTRFDAAMELAEERKKEDEYKKKQGALDNSRNKMTPSVKKDGDDNTPDAAYGRMVRADEDAWKLDNETK